MLSLVNDNPQNIIFESGGMGLNYVDMKDSRAIQDIGNAYFKTKKYKIALECYQKQLNLTFNSDKRKSILQKIA